jgi:type III secretion system YscD/HrpQ family protein
MTVKLVNISDSDKDLTLIPDEADNFIGRDPDESQLLIADPKVSRKHAQISYSEGIYTLLNLSQTNPIFVNDEQLQAPCALKQGDKIKIGDSVFHFFDDTQPQAPQDQSIENTSTSTEDNEENPYETIFEEFSELDDDTDVNFTESQRFLLKVLTGPNTGAEFPLEEGRSYTIGTDTHECDVIFHDLSVSRKHAQLKLSKEGQLTITDLNSRNGVLVDGQTIEGERNIQGNNLISLGTSTFTVVDYENASETLISPNLDNALLTGEVKVSLDEIENGKPKEETNTSQNTSTEKLEASEATKGDAAVERKKKNKKLLPVAFLISAILFFTLINVSASLFKTEDVVKKTVNHQEEIQQTLVNFEKVEFSYRKNTGELFLQGHVLDSVEKNQLLYQLQALTYISSVQDYIIIDELIIKEHNEIFSKKPDWKGITIQTPKPGRFIITGYLETAVQAEALAEYINRRFEFIDLLENKVAVEELLLLAVENKFLEKFPRFNEVKASLINGELKFDGMIKAKDKKAFDTIVLSIKELRGIRKINNYVVEVQESETIINISRQYNITGYSKHDNVNINVIVNGKILARGDALDGMTVTTILPHAILLEKNGLKYKIDYKK